MGVYHSFVLCARNQRIEDTVRRPLGLWLRDNTPPGDRIMPEPVGYVGYYSRRPILDVIGLVSPQVLPYWREASQAPMRDIALAFRPEWCVLRPAELANIHAAHSTPGVHGKRTTGSCERSPARADPTEGQWCSTSSGET